MPRTSAPRKRVDRLVRVADDDEVAAVAGDRAQQRDLAGVGVLVLVDEDVRVARARSSSRCGLGLDGRAPDQVGVVDGAAAVEDRRGTAPGTAPAATNSGRSCSLAQRAQAAAVEPLLAGPGSTACTSRAKPRVPSARRQRRRASATDSGWSLEQLAQHDVLLGRREQPERRRRRARPARSVRISP